MKRILTAGLALAMGSAVANATDFGSDGAGASILSPQPFSGHLELYGTGVWQNYWDSYYSPYRGLGGASRLNWWFAPEMSAQFDFAGHYGADSYYDYYWTGAVYGAAHLSKRTDTNLMGVFLGLAGTSGISGYGWDTSLFGGVEGQWYNGPFTIYAQLGGIGQLSGYYGPSYYTTLGFGVMWFGQVEGRYFITPNTKISGNVGFMSGDFYGASSMQTTFSYGAEIEHRFNSNPFSIFARLQGFSGGGYYTVAGYRATGGFRLNWGSSNLQEQDRSGATLKVMEDLAPLGDMRSFY